MRRFKPRLCVMRFAAGLMLSIGTVAALAGVVAPDLERAMSRRGTHADTAVIVRFTDALEHEAYAVTDRRGRDNRLLLALKARAARNRAAVEDKLVALRAQSVKNLWIVNAVSATLPAAAVRDLAAQPGVDRIDVDAYVQGARTQRTPPPRVPFPAEHAASAPPTSAVPQATAHVVSKVPAWNVAAVNAPQLWALGHTGQGVVVAAMDTGVDPVHPDLRRTWRGGTNSWFDPHGEEAAPYDAIGHGTQSMGVVVGGSGLGVAPDARWIAVRLYSAAGRARMSDFHQAFQWLMDPDGDPATIDAPDVVNASWALTGRATGTCYLEFSDDIRALRNAGIAVVFASGNDGPAAGTSNSPGNNPGVISVGAVDHDLTVMRQSSRGPSACDGAVFPRLVAPGTNVRTTDLSHGGVRSYTQMSGSSLAAPHVAGLLALLAGAFPSASVAELEAALIQSARELGDAGADNSHGHGLVDALAAFTLLRRDQRSAAQDQDRPVVPVHASR